MACIALAGSFGAASLVSAPGASGTFTSWGNQFTQASSPLYRVASQLPSSCQAIETNFAGGSRIEGSVVFDRWASGLISMDVTLTYAQPNTTYYFFGIAHVGSCSLFGLGPIFSDEFGQGHAKFSVFVPTVVSDFRLGGSFNGSGAFHLDETIAVHVPVPH